MAKFHTDESITRVWDDDDHYLGLQYIRQGWKIKEIAAFLDRRADLVAKHFAPYKKQWAFYKSNKLFRTAHNG